MKRMTEQEQRLVDDKMRAEIAKLIEETAKIKTERTWLPITITATGVAAAITAVNLLINTFAS